MSLCLQELCLELFKEYCHINNNDIFSFWLQITICSDLLSASRFSFFLLCFFFIWAEELQIKNLLTEPERSEHFGDMVVNLLLQRAFLYLCLSKFLIFFLLHKCICNFHNLYLCLSLFVFVFVNLVPHLGEW